MNYHLCLFSGDSYRKINLLEETDGGMAMSSYEDYKKRALQNPEVKTEYEALQPEPDIIQAMIDARVQQNMTQKELSELRRQI